MYMTFGLTCLGLLAGFQNFTSATSSRTMQLTAINIGHFPISDLKTGDFNHDGLQDLVISFDGTSDDLTKGSATAICWDYQHTYDADLQTFTNCTSIGNVAHTSSIAVADMNGDGFSDIIQFNTGNSYIYTNNGSGQFTSQAFYSSNCDTLLGTVNDFNGDGHTDLAYVPLKMSHGCSSGSPVSGNLTVVYGGTNTTRTFVLPNSEIVGRQSIGLASGPLSQTNFSDIVIGNFRDGGFYILKNLSNGVFANSVQQISAIATTPRDVYNFTLADVTGDGKRDLLLANFQSGGQSYLYKNLGAGNFQSGQALPQSGGILNFAAQDVINGGTAQMVAAKSRGGSFYKIDAGGNFIQTGTYNLTNETYIKSPMQFWNLGDHINMVIGFYSGNLQMYSFPAGGCPATILSDPANPNSAVLTRQTRSSIYYYNSNNTQGFNTAVDVDITNWNNLFGRFHWSDPIVAFPGVGGSAPTFRNGWYIDSVTPQFGRLNYVSLKFHVPSVTHSINGFYTNAQSPWSSGPPITASLSQTCGDFVNIPPACVVRNWHATDTSGLSWTVDSSNPRCALQANTDYYLNMKLFDPAVVDQRCNSQACVSGLTHYTSGLLEP